jgi:hypothetical protein
MIMADTQQLSGKRSLVDLLVDLAVGIDPPSTERVHFRCGDPEWSRDRSQQAGYS